MTPIKIPAKNIVSVNNISLVKDNVISAVNFNNISYFNYDFTDIDAPTAFLTLSSFFVEEGSDEESGTKSDINLTKIETGYSDTINGTKWDIYKYKISFDSGIGWRRYSGNVAAIYELTDEMGNLRLNSSGSVGQAIYSSESDYIDNLKTLINTRTDSDQQCFVIFGDRIAWADNAPWLFNDDTLYFAYVPWTTNQNGLVVNVKPTLTLYDEGSYVNIASKSIIYPENSSGESYDYAANSLFGLPTNYGTNDVTELSGKEIVNSYQKGKQSISLDIFYLDYYDINGNLVYSGKDAKNINVDDIIVPYVIRTRNGVATEEPIKTINGQAVQYKVTSVSLVYNGQLILSLEAQEYIQLEYTQPPSPEVFTITFNVNGGNPIAPVTVTEGTYYVLPIPTRNNTTEYKYEFVCWRDSFWNIVSALEVHNNVTVIAEWKEIQRNQTLDGFTFSYYPSSSDLNVSVYTINYNYTINGLDVDKEEINLNNLKITVYATGAGTTFVLRDFEETQAEFSQSLSKSWSSTYFSDSYGSVTKRLSLTLTLSNGNIRLTGSMSKFGYADIDSYYDQTHGITDGTVCSLRRITVSCDSISTYE